MSMCVSREARTGLCAKRDRLFLVLERGQAVCVRGRIIECYLQRVCTILYHKIIA